MALLHCDGFDSKTVALPGRYSVTLQNSGEVLVYGTGRTGTGFSFRGGGDLIEVTKTLPAAISTVIVGLAVKNGGGSGTINPSTLLAFLSNGNAVPWVKIGGIGNNNPGRLAFATGSYSGGGTEIAATSALVPSATFQYIEIKLTCSTGTGGSIIVKQDGMTTLNATGLNTGSANVNAISLRLGGTGGGGVYTWGYAPYIDDWYICDTSGTFNNDFLGDVNIKTLVPIGNGSNSGLLGSDGDSTDNYALVDDVPPVGTDYVGSDTVGAKDTYDFSSIVGRPRGLVVNAQVSGYGSGRAIIRGSNGITAGGADIAMGTTKMTSTVFETDPATGVQWTQNGLNAAEIGWEVR